MEGSDVRLLQSYLSTDQTIYTGKITGIYDTATERAVQRFQRRYSIVTGGTAESTGYGVFGPKTQAKFKEVFSIK